MSVYTHQNMLVVRFRQDPRSRLEAELTNVKEKRILEKVKVRKLFFDEQVALLRKKVNVIQILNRGKLLQ